MQTFSGVYQILLPGKDDILLGQPIHSVGLEKVERAAGQAFFKIN